MNNFPVEQPTDLFGAGIVGSCGGLFESQLNFVNDLPLLYETHPHPLVYSSDLQNDFSTITNAFDISVINNGEPSMTFFNEQQLPATDNGAISAVDENVRAVVNNVTADVYLNTCVVGDSEICKATPVTETGDYISDVVTEGTNVCSTEEQGDQNAVCEVTAECRTECTEIIEEPTIDISISNVVCAFSTKCYLSLKRIAQNGMNVEYKKATGTVLMKIRKPMVTANIWASGKVTCTGSRSEEEARIAARRVARCLQRIYENAKFAEFRIVNVLGSCSLPFGIRITEFSRNYPKEASYEPEIHPGVTYKIVSPKATLKIFSTGSITVTAPRISNVQRAIEHIYPLVVKFRMDRSKAEPLEVQSNAFLHQSKFQSMKSFKRLSTWNQKAKRARFGNDDGDASEDDVLEDSEDDW